MSHITIIKHYESLHDGDLTQIGLQPKACPAGWITAGWGRVLRDPRTNRMLENKSGDWAIARNVAGTINEETAEDWLNFDTGLLMREIEKTIGGLKPHEYGALVSFVYNIGIGKFRTSTLLQRLKANDIKAAELEFYRWDKATVNGQLVKLDGLTARRNTEALYFRTGEVVLFKKNKDGKIVPV